MTANNSTKDGLGFEEVNQTDSSTENVVAVNISGTTVYGTAVIGTTVDNSDGVLTSVGVGSPTTYGASIHAGIGSLTTGSLAWVVFPTPFTAAPIVTTNNITERSKEILVGSASVGSFIALGETASNKFNWLAVGL